MLSFFDGVVVVSRKETQTNNESGNNNVFNFKLIPYFLMLV